MSCNCNSGDTPEYYITLDGVGADGYSPEINVTQEDTASFRLNLINKDNEQLTPIIPKLSYLNDNFVTNSVFSATLANYSTTAQIAATYLSKSDAATSYLKVDGSNASNPITINNLSIQSIGTGTRIGSSGGALTLQGTGVRPAYLQTGSTSKSLALFTDLPTRTSQLTNDSGFLTASDITNKMETNGSNAATTVTFNNLKLSGRLEGTGNGFNIQNSNGNISIMADDDIYLITGTNRNVYYNTNEVATVDQIPIVNNATITLTQGGVVKGSFTLNQSGSATIALDSGGSTIGNQISLVTEDSTRSLTIGVDNTTKRVIANYNTLSEGAVSSSIPINLIKSVTAPIIISASSVDGLCDISLSYDNNTLKVNGSGELYADIEAPTYTAGTGININNEEISVDSNYVEAHKAYLADGDTLTDPQGLEDVKYYNKSSFDLSKFTVVGSPTITDDGIVSGVSRNDYLTIPVFDLTNFTFSMSFEVTSLDTTTVLQNDNTIWRIPTTQTYRNRLSLYSDKTLGVGVLLEDTTNDASTLRTGALTALGRYKTIFMFNGTKYTFIVVYPDGSIVTKELSSTSKLSSNSNPVFIAANSTDAERSFIAGNIDLKSIEVKNYDIPVFSGNKTGIDTIKPDNYTVVGSPTISADGVASGFSDLNYIRIPIPDLSTANTWEIDGKFKLSALNTSNGSYVFSSSSGNPVLLVGVNASNHLTINLGNSAGSGWQTSEQATASAQTLSTNIDYYYKFIFTGTAYQLFVSTDNDTFIKYCEFISSTKIGYNSNWNFTLGNSRNPIANSALKGSIDLNSFKIYIDGNLVYQPCLKIPYTESKTGSKVVDSAYRSRVNDMAEQFGYSPYYTLDEASGNFTLPMGEIYGYITRLEGIVKDLQTRLSALESNINGGGAGVVQQSLLGMSPLSLGRPQLLGEFNPEDEMNTMDIEPVEDEIAQEEIEEEPQTIENEVVQEEADEGGEDE